MNPCCPLSGQQRGALGCCFVLKAAPPLGYTQAFSLYQKMGVMEGHGSLFPELYTCFSLVGHR